MKKITHGSITCEVAMAKDWTLRTELPCDYEPDTVAYAAERFITHSPRLRRECTYESWQLRVESGRGRRPHRFSWVVPAALLELPGAWVRLGGVIDPVGVTVRRVELLKEYPRSFRAGS